MNRGGTRLHRGFSFPVYREAPCADGDPLGIGDATSRDTEQVSEIYQDPRMPSRPELPALQLHVHLKRDV